eukprot:gene5847-7276_t
MKYLIVAILFVATILYTTNANPQLCLDVSECPKGKYCNPRGGQGYCTSCISNNDCGLNEFCSTNQLDLSKFGTCQKFKIDGDECIAYNSGELANVKVRNDTKCAEMYYVPATDSMAVDYQGSCINGKCRICNYASTGADSTNGKNVPRVCVFPGKYATPHSRYWSSGAYFEEPLRVWLAILFCLVVIILAFHGLGFIMHK